MLVRSVIDPPPGELVSTTVEAALVALAGVVIAPVITVVLAGLSSWLKQRSERRDRDHERRRVLTQVREEIDIIEAWVKAYDLVAPPELRSQASSRAQNQLEAAYTRLAESLEVSREVTPQKTFREYLKSYLKGPQPRLSRHPVWRKTYLWLISIIGMIACTTVLASTLVPSTGRGDQPAGAVLGVLGFAFSAWIGMYAHRIPLNTAKDTVPQHAEQKNSDMPAPLE